MDAEIHRTGIVVLEFRVPLQYPPNPGWCHRPLQIIFPLKVAEKAVTVSLSPSWSMICQAIHSSCESSFLPYISEPLHCDFSWGQWLLTAGSCFFFSLHFFRYCQTNQAAFLYAIMYIYMYMYYPLVPNKSHSIPIFDAIQSQLGMVDRFTSPWYPSEIPILLAIPSKRASWCAAIGPEDRRDAILISEAVRSFDHVPASAWRFISKGLFKLAKWILTKHHLHWYVIHLRSFCPLVN